MAMSMENRLRNLGNYYFVIIVILGVFWLYRLPHIEDYKYDEKTVFVKIQVVDSTLEILEVDLSQYAFGENEYFLFKSPSFSSKISIEDGFEHMDRGNDRDYDKQVYKKLAYYSFNEDVFYDAGLPQSVMDKIEIGIAKTKAKSRYFRYYYSVADEGKIFLKVMEEWHGRENKNKNDVFIISCDYQAKKIDMTETLREKLEKYFPKPPDSLESDTIE